jgi:hypothetical protein
MHNLKNCLDVRIFQMSSLCLQKSRMVELLSLFKIKGAIKWDILYSILIKGERGQYDYEVSMND